MGFPALIFLRLTPIRCALPTLGKRKQCTIQGSFEKGALYVCSEEKGKVRFVCLLFLCGQCRPCRMTH